MTKIVYFDICAICVYVMLIISLLSKKRYMGKQNKTFLLLVVIFLLTTVADFITLMLDYTGTHYSELKYTFNTIYIFLHTAVTTVYAMFIVSVTDTKHIIRRNFKLKACLIIPLIISGILLIANLFTGYIFYINNDGYYTRSTYFALIYVPVIFYLGFALIYLLRYKSLFSRGRFIAFFILYPLLALAALIQYINDALVIEMFINSIGLLYISMLITRNEEEIDTHTGFNSSISYVQALERAVATNNHLKIILINITNYRVIKNILGFDGAVKLEQKIADKLVKIADSRDKDITFYHHDSGRFAIALEEDMSDEMTTLAKAINEELKQNITVNQLQISLITCVCVVNYLDDIENSTALTDLSYELDAEYYTGEVLNAKEVYTSSHFDVIKDIDNIIEHALSNNEFEVYYQPIYSIKGESFRSAEALCRLHRADGSFISPDIFIPAAEKSGAIHKIGEFVLDEVCKFIASEEYKKLDIHYIEVNLSVAQCMQKELATNVLATIGKHDINVSNVNLEITETATSFSQNTLQDNLNALTAAGVKLSLDDFGTGYSNMMRISTLNLNIVKLDKIFADLAVRKEGEIVINNMVRMIKELNMEIIVEGVEDEIVAKKFAELDCEYIQGYYYSRPLPKNEFIKFIEKANCV